MMWRVVAMDRRQASLALLIAMILPSVAVASGGGEKKKGGGVSFLQLGAITATVLRANGRRGALTVEVGVDVPNPALQVRATQLAPRFRAAFVQTLQTYAAGLPPAALPNADFLSREMQRQTDLVLGAKGGKLLLGTILVN